MMEDQMMKEGKIGEGEKNMGFIGGMEIKVIKDLIVGYIEGEK